MRVRVRVRVCVRVREGFMLQRTSRENWLGPSVEGELFENK